MVRHYKPKIDAAGNPVRKKLGGSNLQRAIDAVHTNTLSQRQAAVLYGITRATLQRYLDDYSPTVVKKTAGHPTVLTLEEEQLLVHATIAGGYFGFPRDNIVRTPHPPPPPPPPNLRDFENHFFEGGQFFLKFRGGGDVLGGGLNH